MTDANTDHTIRGHRETSICTPDLCNFLFRENEQLQAELKEAKEALSDLYDEQRAGPPLIRHQREWEAAMARASRVLGYTD